MTKGLFISIEGTDGAGKSTQISKIKAYFEEQGREVVLTREPGGTAIGEKIRELLLDKENSEMTPLTEALLYASARAQHISQVIRPALDEGKIVICDRFVDSSIAYQGYGRNLGDVVRQINDCVVSECMPDVTFFLKLDPNIGHTRIDSREQDRLELESMNFHQRVFEGYKKIQQADPKRVIEIDAGRSIEEIALDIVSKLKELE